MDLRTFDVWLNKFTQKRESGVIPHIIPFTWFELTVLREHISLAKNTCVVFYMPGLTLHIVYMEPLKLVTWSFRHAVRRVWKQEKAMRIKIMGSLSLWLSKTNNLTVTPTFWNDRPGVEKCENRQSSMLILSVGRAAGVALSKKWGGKWLKPASNSEQQQIISLAPGIAHILKDAAACALSANAIFYILQPVFRSLVSVTTSAVFLPLLWPTSCLAPLSQHIFGHGGWGIFCSSSELVCFHLWKWNI